MKDRSVFSTLRDGDACVVRDIKVELNAGSSPSRVSAHASFAKIFSFSVFNGIEIFQSPAPKIRTQRKRMFSGNLPIFEKSATHYDYIRQYPDFSNDRT